MELEPSNAEPNPSGAATVLQKTQMRVPGMYYIAITNDMAEAVARRSHILDSSFFHTLGYIPVCSTSDAACEALNQHYQEMISRYKLFRIRIRKDSNLYWRADNRDKLKHRLFFPIPLARHEHTDLALRTRWWEQCRNVTSYPHRWVRDSANFKKLEVEELI